MAWGRKDATPNWRFGFSFYVESPLWQSCKEIRADDEVMAYAREQGWYLCDHSLDESLVINVGYVVGKHPDLTYRAGLAREIQEHLQSQNPEGPELSISIGFSRIQLGETRIPILAVQCGASQRDSIEAILGQNVNHSTIDIISAQLKKSDPAAFSQAINDHMNCRDQVTAIPIAGVPIRFYGQLRRALLERPPGELQPLILDLERTRDSYHSEKFCVIAYKEKVPAATIWLTAQLQALNTAHGLAASVTPSSPRPTRRSKCTATYVSRHTFAKQWDGVLSYAVAASHQPRQPARDTARIPAPPVTMPSRKLPATATTSERQQRLDAILAAKAQPTAILHPATATVASDDTAARFRRLEDMMAKTEKAQLVLKQDLNTAIDMLTAQQARVEQNFDLGMARMEKLIEVNTNEIAELAAMMKNFIASQPAPASPMKPMAMDQQYRPQEWAAYPPQPTVPQYHTPTHPMPPPHDDPPKFYGAAPWQGYYQPQASRINPLQAPPEGRGP